MRLDNDFEKDALEKISVLSGKSPTIVKEVLQSVLIMCTLEIYKQEKKNIENIFEIYLPYICKLVLSCTENGLEKKITLKTIPAKALIEEVTAIMDGDETPTIKFIKNQIKKNIDSLLEVPELESIDEI